MSGTTDRYEVRRVTDIEWIIRDRRYHEEDPRSAVARIWEVDAGEYEVTWTRDLPLSTSYASVADALADLSAVRRHTKPVPIPHYPPVCPSVDDSGRPAVRP